MDTFQQPINLKSPEDQRQDNMIKGLAQSIQILVQHVKKIEADIEELKKALPKPRKTKKKMEVKE